MCLPCLSPYTPYLFLPVIPYCHIPVSSGRIPDRIRILSQPDYGI